MLPPSVYTVYTVPTLPACTLNSCIASQMTATRELVDAYMAAVEAKDGAALFAVCDESAKIFGTGDELFIDLAEVADAAACDAIVKEKMGPVTLTYENRCHSGSIPNHILFKRHSSRLRT